jgi:hypothetical protein
MLLKGNDYAALAGQVEAAVRGLTDEFANGDKIWHNL